MKNHFIFGWFGNKRKECERLYDTIKDDLNDVKTIVEPFAGSFAISVYISMMNPDKKFKYIINDNNDKLIEMMEILRDNKKIKQFETTIINIMTPYPTKEEYKEFIKQDNVYAWYIKQKFYNVRPGFYPDPSHPRSQCHIKRIERGELDIIKCPVVQFIQNNDIKFSVGDGVKLFKKYQNDKNTFVFLDPPYMLSENSYYDKCKNNNDNKENMFKYLYDNMKNIKCKCSIIINCTWIMKALFRDFNIIEYKKKYGNHERKKTSHMIVKLN